MNPLGEQKAMLTLFWDKAGRTGMKYKQPSRLSKDATIKLLRDYGELKWSYNSTHTRKHFDSIKDNRKRFTGFKHCFACHQPAEVRHHIVWLKHGGRNTKYNIVPLCRSCHALIHDWL